MQLCDVLGTALGTGVAGAAVAIVHQHGGPARLGLGLAFAMAAVSRALLALAVAPRLPTRHVTRQPDGGARGRPSPGRSRQTPGLALSDE